MEFQTWHDLLVFFITVAVALLGTGVTQWLKIKLLLADKWALVLTAAVAIVLSVGELFITGALSGEMFVVANLPGTLAMIFSLATVFYKLLLADNTNG